MENLNPQNDPGLWPIKITDVDRTDIVLKGPIRVKVDLFPCRIFGLENTKIGSSEGACDWKHLGDYLKSHESSRQHKDCMLKWSNLENGLKSYSTILTPWPSHNLNKKGNVGEIF
ncbi:hypothetical protein QE152_g3851 [Popillia japonica]|uniref:Uncharacterized protein n=1 Tax=Popillia japonica TaxID=7064 RepID=A0AAW1MYY6_POPJA